MRRLALLLPVVVVTSCTFFDWESTRRNPRYCQSDNDCKDSSLPFCDTQAQECEAAPVCQPICGDGGADMHADQDMGACTAVCGDMAGADLTSGPDLSCTDSASCGDTTPVCEGTCRACASSTDDTQCGLHNAATPLCGSSGKCVACRIAMDCTVATLPLCDTNGSCRACTTGDDSACSSRSSGALPKCDVPSGKCVQCVSNGDCTSNMAAPICGANKTCRACQSNSECSSGACKSTGACADPSTEIYYVNNRGSTISSCKIAHPTADGSSGNAFCDIADALGSPSPRPYLVVSGSGSTYTNLTINSTPAALTNGVTIIGPGHNASPPALVTPTGAVVATPAILVSTTAAVNLTVDGLELVGTASAIPAAGIKCQVGTGAAMLKALNSYVHASGLVGIDASSCALTLDANIISGNTGGGIKISDGTITASNNLIVANGLSGPGVNFQGSVSGTFWFNTVADNTQTGTSGAFNCTGTAAPLIQAAIVWGNSHPVAGSSIVGTACTFSYSDIDETLAGGINGAGNFNQDPLLTTGTLPAGYRLPSGSPCANKVTAATGLSGTLPTHDVDVSPRPRPSTGGYDCGGSQAP